MKSCEMISKIVELKINQIFFSYNREFGKFEFIKECDTPKVGNRLLVVGKTSELISEYMVTTNDWDFGFLYNNRIFFTDRMSARYFNTVFKVVK